MLFWKVSLSFPLSTLSGNIFIYFQIFFPNFYFFPIFLFFLIMWFLPTRYLLYFTLCLNPIFWRIMICFSKHKLLCDFLFNSFGNLWFMSKSVLKWKLLRIKKSIFNLFWTVQNMSLDAILRIKYIFGSQK